MSDFTTHRHPEMDITYRWWRDPTRCSHANENVCDTCDFDGYYANLFSDDRITQCTVEDITGKRCELAWGHSGDHVVSA